LKMTTVFKYQKERSKIGNHVLRPVAEVGLIADNREIRVPMYIDSGADITLIPRLLGESLGFEVGDSKIIELSGVGEKKVPVVIKKVILIIGIHNLDARIAWSLMEEVPPLLGRMDVFRRFRIIFDEEKETIRFENRQKNLTEVTENE